MLHPEVKGGFVPLIKDWKDLMSEVSEKQSLCGSLKDSRFFGPFKDQVDKFEEKLALLDELLLCMNKVQRKWVYLEPIFGRGSLPREKERFDKMNNQYRQIMKNVGSQKKVNYLCNLTTCLAVSLFLGRVAFQCSGSTLLLKCTFSISCYLLPHSKAYSRPSMATQEIPRVSLGMR